MGAFDRMLGAVGLSRRSTLAQPSEWMYEAFGNLRSGAGVTVTPETAMRFSAVWACVRLIAGSVATLPLHVYEQAGNTRNRRDDHPVARLLRTPCRGMTSVVFMETLTAHVLLWGNCYAAIIRNGAGEPIELIPVMPQGVTVLRTSDGGLAYDVGLPSGERVRIGQADMLHVPGLGFDGLQGLSPVRYAAQSIGLGIAAEQYGASFFGNSSIPAGYISMPGKLSGTQADLLRDQWNGIHGGAGNSGRTAVIPGGGEFKRIAMPNNEAQFLESRKFSITDIARWYLVPPHMVGDLEKATFSNIEHQALEFVQHCLRPWLVRWEQELDRKLLPPQAVGMTGDTVQTVDSPFYVEFNVDGLLRGDSKAQADYFQKALGGPGALGWMTVNEVRALKRLPPVEGGDTIFDPKSASAPATPTSEETA